MFQITSLKLGLCVKLTVYVLQSRECYEESYALAWCALFSYVLVRCRLMQTENDWCSAFISSASHKICDTSELHKGGKNNGKLSTESCSAAKKNSVIIDSRSILLTATLHRHISSACFKSLTTGDFWPRRGALHCSVHPSESHHPSRLLTPSCSGKIKARFRSQNISFIKRGKQVWQWRFLAKIKCEQKWQRGIRNSC